MVLLKVDIRPFGIVTVWVLFYLMPVNTLICGIQEIMLRRISQRIAMTGLLENKTTG
jgi:hypothetical protein